LPYLEDEMRTQGQYVSIIEMRHGGKKKTERIVWSLQGRMEHGQITFNEDRLEVFRLTDGRLPEYVLSHDDMLDALAYIDQVSVADFAHNRIRR
jgi:hypothetical protein